MSSLETAQQVLPETSRPEIPSLLVITAGYLALHTPRSHAEFYQGRPEPSSQRVYQKKGARPKTANGPFGTEADLAVFLDWEASRH